MLHKKFVDLESRGESGSPGHRREKEESGEFGSGDGV